jgi:hypothetical protein
MRISGWPWDTSIQNDSQPRALWLRAAPASRRVPGIVLRAGIGVILSVGMDQDCLR